MKSSCTTATLQPRMFNKAETFFRTIILILFLMGISACGSQIIYDDYDPNVHDKTVILKSPMVYVDLSLTGFKIEELYKYDKWLTRKSVWEGNNYEAVATDAEFKIVKSFWYKQTPYNSIFVSDIHYVVLKDEKNRLSVTFYRIVEDLI